MGRLDINNNNINTYVNNNLSGNTTNIFTLLDNNGNVTQIKKIKKNQYKNYIDSERILIENCFIRISETENGEDCSFGISLGFGDDTISQAIY